MKNIIIFISFQICLSPSQTWSHFALILGTFGQCLYDPSSSRFSGPIGNQFQTSVYLPFRKRLNSKSCPFDFCLILTTHSNYKTAFFFPFFFNFFFPFLSAVTHLQRSSSPFILSFDFLLVFFPPASAPGHPSTSLSHFSLPHHHTSRRRRSVHPQRPRRCVAVNVCRQSPSIIKMGALWGWTDRAQFDK